MKNTLHKKFQETVSKELQEILTETDNQKKKPQRVSRAQEALFIDYHQSNEKTFKNKPIYPGFTGIGTTM